MTCSVPIVSLPNSTNSLQSQDRCKLCFTNLCGLQIAYNIDIVKSNVPEALEILADAVLNPRFTTWEVAEQIVKMEQDIKGLKENPQTVLLEVLR